MMDFKVVSDAAYACGECPMWDHDNKVFLWSDMLGGVLYRYDPEDGKTVPFAAGKNVGGFTCNGADGLICATHQGVFLWDKTNGYQLLADTFHGEFLSCNDAIADPNGRFLFGSAYYNPQNCQTGYPLGKLYKTDTDGRLSVLEEGLHLSNGLGFSPDNRTMYLTDTVLRVIYAYDYDAQIGTALNRRVFVRIPDTEGIPDGMTVDAQGFVWSAQWYGSCVVRYDPDGKVERRIQTPAKQTSSVMFGGDDLTDLYVTTAAKSVRLHVAPEGYDFDAADIGGPVYRYITDIQGKPEYKAQVLIKSI